MEVDTARVESASSLGVPLVVENVNFSSDYEHVSEVKSVTGNYLNVTRAYDVPTHGRLKFKRPLDETIEMPPYAMRINDVHVPDTVFVVQLEHHVVSTTIPTNALNGHYYSMYPAVHRLRNARIPNESREAVRERMLYRFIRTTHADHTPDWMHSWYVYETWRTRFDGVLHPLSMAAVYDRVGEPAPGKFCANVLSSGGSVISNGTPPPSLTTPTARAALRLPVLVTQQTIPYTASPPNSRLYTPYSAIPSLNEPLTVSVEFSAWDAKAGGVTPLDLLNWTGGIWSGLQIWDQEVIPASGLGGFDHHAWLDVESQYRLPTATEPTSNKLLDPFEHSDSYLFSGCAYYKELYYRSHRDALIPFLASNDRGTLVRFNPPADSRTKDVVGKYVHDDDNTLHVLRYPLRDSVADTGLPIVDYDVEGERSNSRFRLIRIDYVEPHAEELSHADFLIENYFIDGANVVWVCDLCTEVSITTDSGFLTTPYLEYWDAGGNVIVNRGNDHRGLVRDRLVYSGVVDPLTVSLGPEAPQIGAPLRFQVKTYESEGGGARYVTLVYRRFSLVRSLFLPDPNTPSLHGINRARWVYVTLELPPDFNLLINDSSAYTIVNQVINGWGDTVKYLNPAPSQLLLFNRVGYTLDTIRIYVTVSTSERYHESTPVSDAVRDRFGFFSDLHPVRFSIQTYKFFKSFDRKGVR